VEKALNTSAKVQLHIITSKDYEARRTSCKKVRRFFVTWRAYLLADTVFFHKDIAIANIFLE
jgi:hypothetical protein